MSDNDSRKGASTSVDGSPGHGCPYCENHVAHDHKAKSFFRLARISVTADSSTLDADAEEDVHGWDWIEEVLELQLKHFVNLGDGVKVEWIEWEGEPEQEGHDA